MAIATVQNVAPGKTVVVKTPGSTKVETYTGTKTGTVKTTSTLATPYVSPYTKSSTSSSIKSTSSSSSSSTSKPSTGTSSSAASLLTTSTSPTSSLSTGTVPQKYWGTSSALYGQVSPTGVVEKTPAQFALSPAPAPITTPTTTPSNLSVADVFGVPKKYWGTSSATYGQVSPTGVVEKTTEQIAQEVILGIPSTTPSIITSPSPTDTKDTSKTTYYFPQTTGLAVSEPSTFEQPSPYYPSLLPGTSSGAAAGLGLPGGVPRKFWGTSSAQYGTVDMQGRVISRRGGVPIDLSRAVGPIATVPIKEKVGGFTNNNVVRETSTIQPSDIIKNIRVESPSAVVSVPKEFWGTSSMKYGEVSTTGIIEKTPEVAAGPLPVSTSPLILSPESLRQMTDYSKWANDTYGTPSPFGPEKMPTTEQLYNYAVSTGITKQQTVPGGTDTMPKDMEKAIFDSERKYLKETLVDVEKATEMPVFGVPEKFRETSSAKYGTIDKYGNKVLDDTTKTKLANAIAYHNARINDISRKDIWVRDEGEINQLNEEGETIKRILGNISPDINTEQLVGMADKPSMREQGLYMTTNPLLINAFIESRGAIIDETARTEGKLKVDQNIAAIKSRADALKGRKEILETPTPEETVFEGKKSDYNNRVQTHNKLVNEHNAKDPTSFTTQAEVDRYNNEAEFLNEENISLQSEQTVLNDMVEKLNLARRINAFNFNSEVVNLNRDIADISTEAKLYGLDDEAIKSMTDIDRAWLAKQLEEPEKLYWAGFKQQVQEELAKDKAREEKYGLDFIPPGQHLLNYLVLGEKTPIKEALGFEQSPEVKKGGGVTWSNAGQFAGDVISSGWEGSSAGVIETLSESYLGRPFEQYATSKLDLMDTSTVLGKMGYTAGEFGTGFVSDVLKHPVITAGEVALGYVAGAALPAIGAGIEGVAAKTAVGKILGTAGTKAALKIGGYALGAGLTYLGARAAYEDIKSSQYPYERLGKYGKDVAATTIGFSLGQRAVLSNLEPKSPAAVTRKGGVVNRYGDYINVKEKGLFVNKKGVQMNYDANMVVDTSKGTGVFQVNILDKTGKLVGTNKGNVKDFFQIFNRGSIMGESGMPEPIFTTITSGKFGKGQIIPRYQTVDQTVVTKQPYDIKLIKSKFGRVSDTVELGRFGEMKFPWETAGETPSIGMAYTTDSKGITTIMDVYGNKWVLGSKVTSALRQLGLEEQSGLVSERVLSNLQNVIGKRTSFESFLNTVGQKVSTTGEAYWKGLTKMLASKKAQVAIPRGGWGQTTVLEPVLESPSGLVGGSTSGVGASVPEVLKAPTIFSPRAFGSLGTMIPWQQTAITYPGLFGVGAITGAASIPGATSLLSSEFASKVSDLTGVESIASTESIVGTLSGVTAKTATWTEPSIIDTTDTGTIGDTGTETIPDVDTALDTATITGGGAILTGVGTAFGGAGFYWPGGSGELAGMRKKGKKRRYIRTGLITNPFRDIAGQWWAKQTPKAQIMGLEKPTESVGNKMMRLLGTKPSTGEGFRAALIRTKVPTLKGKIRGL